MSDLEGNLKKAEAYLARFKNDGVLNQIGGEAVPAARRRDLRDACRRSI